MDGAQLDRVEKAVERLEDVSQALKRAVVGSEDEGNPGLLRRVGLVERRIDRLRWSLPAALFSGAVLSGLMTSFIPL